MGSSFQQQIINFGVTPEVGVGNPSWPMLTLFVGPLHSIPCLSYKGHYIVSHVCLSHQSEKMKIEISMGILRWKHTGSLTLGSWAYPKFPFLDDHSFIDSEIAWSIDPWFNKCSWLQEPWLNVISFGASSPRSCCCIAWCTPQCLHGWAGIENLKDEETEWVLMPYLGVLSG